MNRETEKTFDAVAFMRAARERIAKDLEDLEETELQAYVQRNIPDELKDFGRRSHLKKGV